MKHRKYFISELSNGKFRAFVTNGTDDTFHYIVETVKGNQRDSYIEYSLSTTKNNAKQYITEESAKTALKRTKLKETPHTVKRTEVFM